MQRKSDKSLKIIRFEGEMLPNWAQLLDLAARSCPVPEETRRWFSRFTNSSGVDDARTVMTQAETLLRALREHKAAIISNIQATPDTADAPLIIAGWEYALDTLTQQAFSKETCSWVVEGTVDDSGGNYGDGDITLRRV